MSEELAMEVEVPRVGSDTRRTLEDIKIHCLSHGVRVTDRAHRLMSEFQNGLLTLHEYPTTGGLTFELPHGVYVNAPFDEHYCEAAHVVVDVDDDALVLRLRDEAVPVVRQLPLPGYLDVQASTGLKITEIVMSHGDRVRLSPIDGCAYDCSFCDMAELPYIRYSTEELVEALAIAAADEVLPVRHALISGGSPRARHYEEFERTVTSIIESTHLPMDLMMSPQVNNDGLLDRLKASGLQDFSINIEVFAPAPALSVLGMKYKTTRRHFDHFASRAVEACNSGGQVRSLIIVGLESVDETVAGVDHLASLGVVPVLSPFRPAGGTRAVHIPPVPAEDLREVLDRSREVAASHGLQLGPDCLACQHNTLNFPWDAQL